MSDLVLEIGDIVEGTREWNIPWGRGEVIDIQSKIAGISTTTFAVVQYNNVKSFRHFRVGSEEVRRIGKKIPVINIKDLI